jgi:hypothetical protein
MKKILRQRGHQGDVQLKRVAAIPTNAKRIENKPVALGEKSGHMHVMTGNEVEMYQDEQGHVFYNVGTDGATLHHIHESNFKGYTKREQGAVADHPAIEFEAGIYEAWIQNQFNPYSKTFEKVLD